MTTHIITITTTGGLEQSLEIAKHVNKLLNEHFPEVTCFEVHPCPAGVPSYGHYSVYAVTQGNRTPARADRERWEWFALGAQRALSAS